jgi:predicted nicotinamide N-methyase
MDNPAMPALRWVLLAAAVVVCAWFALGAVQTHDEDRATTLVDRFSTPSPALTARILSMLSTAGTLNPDRNIELLRSEALTRAGRKAAGIAAARSVTRAEPQNVDAWVVLDFAAGSIDPALSSLARAQEQKLAPPVAAAP